MILLLNGSDFVATWATPPPFEMDALWPYLILNQVDGQQRENNAHQHAMLVIMCLVIKDTQLQQ